jgi:hypothetical protein
MLWRLMLSAVLAGILATTCSAQPTPKRHDNSTVPVTGSEAWFLPSSVIDNP